MASSAAATLRCRKCLASTRGSGIFTQSGGVNINYAPLSTFDYNLIFSSLQLGTANGGYGEYDMSGGALGANAIFVGENATNTATFGVTGLAGTGVFNQTGGTIGSFVRPRAYEQCRWSGGGRQLERRLGEPIYHTTTLGPTP